MQRTMKQFSCAPVDLTLEQTINADAKSHITGITAFFQSISAMQRWMITQSMGSAIVGELLSQAGMKKRESVTQETKPYHIH